MDRMNTDRAHRSAERSFAAEAPRCATDHGLATSGLVPLAVALAAWLFAALLASMILVRTASAEAPDADLTPAAGIVPAALAVEPAAAPTPSEPRDLDRLLSVPSTHARRNDARSTDEEIAAAVRLGNGDRYVRPSGFRKRNLDLFRTEHPVEIGEQEMLLRLRLRAKARRAMSVELRF